MSDAGRDQTQVIGQRPAMTRRQLTAQRLLLVMLAGLVVLWVFTGHWPSVMIVLGINAFGLIQNLVPPTTVDAAGIRRPWRRRRFIPWSQVESVAAPQPGVYSVQLNLIGGKSLPLSGIRAEYAARVAELGGRPLVKPPRLTLPPPLPRHRTDQEIEADVARRAQALAERGKLLDAEYRRLQR